MPSRAPPPLEPGSPGADEGFEDFFAELDQDDDPGFEFGQSGSGAP